MPLVGRLKALLRGLGLSPGAQARIEVARTRPGGTEAVKLGSETQWRNGRRTVNAPTACSPMARPVRQLEYAIDGFWSDLLFIEGGADPASNGLTRIEHVIRFKHRDRTVP